MIFRLRIFFMKILIILPHLIFIILSTPNTSCSSCMPLSFTSFNLGSYIVISFECCLMFDLKFCRRLYF
nr:MAG TPA: hypothetical protein [Caudoviricetes sp.]